MIQKIKIVVFSSGSGSTFEYLACHPSFHVQFLITNNSSSKVLERAQKLSVPSKIIDPKKYPSSQKWSEALVEALKDFSFDFILLAGFVKKLDFYFLSFFKDRVINSHPSLLPEFGGKGMYGIHVHRAVIKAQKKITGITIHFVNEHYDEGSIIAQKKVEVLESDTPESLQERVKKAEKSFYAQTLEKLVSS